MKNRFVFKRRLLSGAAACLMLFALAGCHSSESASEAEGGSKTDAGVDLPDYIPDGGGTGDDVSGDSQSGVVGSQPLQSGASGSNDSGHGDGGTTADPFAGISKDLKGTTVTVATWGDESAAEYAKVATKFTKDYGIKVKWVTYNQGTYVSSVVQQIAAGSGPDVVINNAFFPSGIEMVQPLTSDFDLNDGFWDKRFTDAFSLGGKNYFVNSYKSPFVGGMLVFYNKKIFSDNGLVSPQDYLDQGKWSYENLKKCMQDVKKIGLQGGIVEPMIIAEQMGSQVVQYDSRTGKFTGNATDPNIVAAFQFHTQCVEEGLTGGYNVTQFSSGQIGLVMTGSFGLKYNGYFKDMSPTEIGAVPLPTSLNGKALEYHPIILRGYGIAKGAKNPKGAYYFLRYYLDMDHYAAAGAKIFPNKVLEKYFMETQIPKYKEAKLVFEYYTEPLDLVGKPWGGTDWIAVRHSPSGQVATELSKMVNICNDAAAAANTKLDSLK